MERIYEDFGRHFEHRGHRLVFDEIGEGDDLVVYMHGLLMDSEMNRGIAAALAGRGHRVVLLDLLGHGRSDRPTHASEYRMDSYAAQAVALLDHLGADDAVFGGVSLGANVSLLAATGHPARVRGLVLEMPVLEWAVPAAALAFTPALLAAHYLAPVLRASAALVRRIPRTSFGALNSVLNSGSVEPEVMAAVLHGVLVGPVAPTVEQRQAIGVPTLILAHGNDLIHPFSDAVNLSEQVPGAVLVRSRSPLELRVFPARLTAEIATFLSDVDGGRLEAVPG